MELSSAEQANEQTNKRVAKSGFSTVLNHYESAVECYGADGNTFSIEMWCEIKKGAGRLKRRGGWDVWEDGGG